MTIPDDEDLADLKRRAGIDPDRIAALEEYVSLLAVRDEAIDDGNDIGDVLHLDAEIDASRARLDLALRTM